MQACGWDIDPHVMSELVYACGQAMSEEGTGGRLIALPPRGKCYESHTDTYFPTNHSALPASEQSVRELMHPPRYYREDATFPDDMDGLPEDLSSFDENHCFEGTSIRHHALL